MNTARKFATWEDVLALPAEEQDRVELIDGQIVQKAAPSFSHGHAQLSVGGWAGSNFRRDPPGGGPAWWIATEVHARLPGGRVVCPDIAGWRKDRHPRLPDERPLPVVPEWVCEVLSASNAAHDLATKVGLYAEARVAHYWILDPEARTLTVDRWTEVGYLVALAAREHVTVRPEPFEAVEVKVATLLGE